MKKIIVILFFAVILFSNSTEAKNTILKEGQVYEGEIIWRRYNIQLPPGNWIYMFHDSVSYSDIDAKTINFVQLQGKLVSQAVSFGEFNGRGRVIGSIAQIINELMFQDDYDGCYERSEYYLVKTFVKGMSINCLLIRHSETRKLYEPDDPKTKHDSARIRKYIKDYNIELPPIMLHSGHCYFAPVVRDSLVCFAYDINPELHGASKSKFITEETSEYHRANINRYPDKKKYMEEWVKLSAHRHRIFEEQVRAKKRHKLDLSEYLKEESQILISSSGDIVNELKKLKKLYDEGALTKEEFIKAKKKLLD